MKVGVHWRLLMAVVLVVAVTGCGDTWKGIKKDTGENMEAAGKAIEKTGEKIK